MHRFPARGPVAHDSTPFMLSQASWAVAVQRALFGLCLLVTDSLRGDWFIHRHGDTQGLFLLRLHLLLAGVA